MMQYGSLRVFVDKQGKQERVIAFPGVRDGGKLQSFVAPLMVKLGLSLQALYSFILRFWHPRKAVRHKVNCA